jgi:acyl-homoserine lactone acylase PvdQ
MLPWVPLPGDGAAEWGSGNDADACNTAPKAGCWVADEDLPQGRNPGAGFFLTANSDPWGDSDDNNPIVNVRRGVPGSNYLSFEWDDPTGFRASRIGELLLARTANGGKVSLDDMMAIQGDHQSKLAKVVLPILRTVPEGSQSAAFKAGLALFEQWSTDGFDCPTGLSGISPSSAPDPDPVHVRQAGACLLFHHFMRNATSNVFKDDLAAARLGRNLGAELRALLYMLDPATAAGDKTFCNDVTASGQLATARTCLEQLQLALASAYGYLASTSGASTNWLWGRVHTMTPVSLAAPLVAAPFTAGPYARPGGWLTVDVGNPGISNADPKAFPYGSGSQVRHVSVMDPAAPIMKLQLPGSNRDVPFAEVAATSHDLLTDYVQNRYFTFAHGTQLDAQGGVVSVQNFTAQ